MRRGGQVVLALLLLAPAAHAGTRRVPDALLRAKTVALGFDTGGRFLSERAAIGRPELVSPYHQDALREAAGQLASWGRYTLVDGPDQADLLVVVRAYRKTSGTVGVDPGGAVSAAVAIGPNADPGGDDVLSVYAAATGVSGHPLWRERANAGAADFPSRGLARLRDAVERAAMSRP